MYEKRLGDRKMKKIIFCAIWFVVIWIVISIVVGAVAGGIAAAGAGVYNEGAQAQNIASQQFMQKYLWLITLSAAFISIFGTIKGFLPGTKE